MTASLRETLTPFTSPDVLLISEENLRQIQTATDNVETQVEKFAFLYKLTVAGEVWRHVTCNTCDTHIFPAQCTPCTGEKTYYCAAFHPKSPCLELLAFGLGCWVRNCFFKT